MLIQLRVGGQDARRGDETWPHEVHCIGQETTGPGGLAKALRTVPVILKVADAVRAHAKPDAWIVDFTNPVGIVTRALLAGGPPRGRALQRGDRVPAPVRRDAGRAARRGLPRARRPQPPDLDPLGHRRRPSTSCPACSTRVSTSWPSEVELPAHLLSLLGAVPSYYLRYYYAHDEVLEEQLHEPTRADAVQAVERELLALYADPSVDTKPEALEQRGGAFYSEAAIEVLSGLVGDTGETRVVNLRNDGTLPFLPDDHVIEVPARVTCRRRRGAAGRAAGRRHPGPRLGRRRLRAARPRRRGRTAGATGCCARCRRTRSCCSTTAPRS